MGKPQMINGQRRDIHKIISQVLHRLFLLESDCRNILCREMLTLVGVGHTVLLTYLLYITTHHILYMKQSLESASNLTTLDTAVG